MKHASHTVHLLCCVLSVLCFPIWPQETFDTETFFEIATEEDAQVHSLSSSITRQPQAILSAIPLLALASDNDATIKRQFRDIGSLIALGLYQKTFPVMNRNVLDLPSVSYIRPHEETACSIYTRSFYNHTDPVAFFDQRHFLSSVTQLQNPEFIDNLRSFVAFLSESVPRIAGPRLPLSLRRTLENEIPTFDIPENVPIFGNIQLQRRQAGTIIEGIATRSRWTCAIQLPVYYLEHNFFVTGKTQNQIEDSRLVQSFSSGVDSDKTEIERFFKAHLVADRIGIGDLRLTLLYDMDALSPFSAYAGLEATIPTAESFSEGLAGGDFDDMPQQPKNAIAEITETSTKTEAVEKGVVFALEALDRLTRIYADRPLGQEHFGIAPLITWHFAGSSCDISGRFRLSYLAPRTRTRFFLEPTSQPLLAAPNYRDRQQTQQNFDFLEKAITRTVFPQPERVTVNPGLSPQVTCSIGQTHPSWHWHFGFDFWYYQGETISLPTHRIQNNAFDVRSAERPRSYQVKAFCSIHMDVATQHYLWHVGVSCDGTIAYAGVGRDVTIGLYAGTDW